MWFRIPPPPPSFPQLPINRCCLSKCLSSVDEPREGGKREKLKPLRVNSVKFNFLANSIASRGIARGVTYRPGGRRASVTSLFSLLLITHTLRKIFSELLARAVTRRPWKDARTRTSGPAGRSRKISRARFFFSRNPFPPPRALSACPQRNKDRLDARSNDVHEYLRVRFTCVLSRARESAPVNTP